MIGYFFNLSSSVSVTGLGFYDFLSDLGVGQISVPHDVGIFDANTQALLVSATVDASGTLVNGFRYTSVSPFLLVAGTYVIVATEPQLSDIFLALGGAPTTAPEVTYVTSARSGSSTLTYPLFAGELNQGLFGPNFTFDTGEATPEPASAGLFLLGGLGLTIWRRRSSRV